MIISLSFSLHLISFEMHVLQFMSSLSLSLWLGVSESTKDKYWGMIAQQLVKGLSDNWSQVSNKYLFYLMPTEFPF